MNSSLRLFFAVDLNTELKDVIENELRSLRPMLQGSSRRMSWVAKENLHLTLKFLGATPEDQVPRVIQAATAALSGISEFEIVIRGVGSFPRVLWLDVEDPSASLSRMALLLEDAMAPLGFAKETRRYVPHLSLARVKEGAPLHPIHDLEKRVATWKARLFGSCPIREVVLFQSRTLKTGAVYVPLAKIPLSARVHVA